MALDGPVPGPINLGNPAEFTILELAQQVIELTGSSSKVVFAPLPSDDPLQRRPDISLAREKLQWEPKVQLREGLARTIEYFEALLGGHPTEPARPAVAGAAWG
jgi:UDP-glucuronate decarboxylase